MESGTRPTASGPRFLPYFPYFWTFLARDLPPITRLGSLGRSLGKDTPGTWRTTACNNI